MAHSPIPAPPQAAPAVRGTRLRAYLEFVLAVLVYFMAQSLSLHASLRFSPDWQPLFHQAALACLLLIAFGALGLIVDREANPIARQGFPLRPGLSGEIARGLATGWGAAVVCVLPLALFGGIAIVLNTQPAAWGWLFADAAFFALAALAEEIAFRGYGFQRFESVVGPFGASIGFAAFYAILTGLRPGANRLAILVAVVFSLVLSMAYVRTRALWFGWGLNFAWKASRALLFGLAVSGVGNHSSVIIGTPMGPLGLTGGGYGLDASLVALAALLVALFAVYRLTRDLDFVHNAPVLVPGGIPVDLDAAARRQHEAAMGAAEPAPAPLVQILPAAPPVPPPGSPVEPDQDRSLS